MIAHGHRINVDFDTDSSACLISRSIVDKYFSGIKVFEVGEAEKLVDIQNTNIPFSGLIYLEVDAV